MEIRGACWRCRVVVHGDSRELVRGRPRQEAESELHCKLERGSRRDVPRRRIGCRQVTVSKDYLSLSRVSAKRKGNNERECVAAHDLLRATWLASV